jgi:phosphonate transport system ATP-binding protein
MLAQADDSPPAGTTGGSLLDARDIWFSYGQRWPVLQGISVSVERGQIVMVLGRSGSGKTTLLRVLKGLLAPDRGSVSFRAGQNGKSPAGRIAYIPQTLGLVRNLTALENALTGALTRAPFARSLVRSFPREIMDETKQTLADLGLAHKINEPAFNLSGGERQRVAIARALMQKPELILADEFLSQLDHVTAREILDLVHTVAGGGVGMLVTTHEIDVVINHADRILIMREGRIVHDEPSSRLSAGALVSLMK